MIQWDLVIKYGEREYTLLAEIDGQTNKTMRIRVYGMKTTIVLSTNYPALHQKGLNKGMMWSLISGKLDQNNPNATKLLADIIAQLEPLVRNKFPLQRPIFY